MRLVDVSSAEPTPAAKSKRRYYLDWLRLIAVLVLLIYHSGRIFDSDPWLIKNAESSVWISAFDYFVSQWRLSLLFLVSGVSSFFALGTRTAGVFVRDRFKRLIIPLILGVLMLVPPQHYLEAISTSAFQPAPRFSGSLLDFYPSYFGDHVFDIKLIVEHLWYLQYLFIYSLVALPLFLALRTASGQSFLERSTSWLGQGPMIVLLAVPLILVKIAMEVLPGLLLGPGVRLVSQIANQSIYAAFFIYFFYGYVIATNQRLNDALLRNRHLALLLALVGAVLRPLLDGLGPSLLGATVYALNVWLWVMALLGYAQIYLSRPNAFLRYATELVAPFYIVHQTVIVAVGFVIIQTELPVTAKFFIVIAFSFGISALACELVRRSDVFRFLFGMNPLKKARARAQEAMLAAAPQRSSAD